MISFFLFLINFAQADLCKQWGEAEHFGNVPAIADESSGLIFSRQFKDRLYHINDGEDAALVVANIEGSDAKEISIDGVKFKDTEELAYNKCPDGKGYCIYIADIGDNLRERPYIQVAVVREEENFAKSIKPLEVYRLHYPDHPHNAEALAIHPDGSLYVVTKEKKKGVAYPAKIFRTSIHKPQSELSLVGEIDIPALSKKSNPEDHVITGMTMSDDGKKFILLSYLHAWEFNFDLSKTIVVTSKLRLGVDYQPIEVKQLTQQEAIVYLPDQKSFIYSTETGNNHFVPEANKQHINIVRCLE